MVFFVFVFSIVKKLALLHPFRLVWPLLNFCNLGEGRVLIIPLLIYLISTVTPTFQDPAKPKRTTTAGTPAPPTPLPTSGAHPPAAVTRRSSPAASPAGVDRPPSSHSPGALARLAATSGTTRARPLGGEWTTAEPESGAKAAEVRAVDKEVSRIYIYKCFRRKVASTSVCPCGCMYKCIYVWMSYMTPHSRSLFCFSYLT